jgi:hypothetical protein
MVLYITQLLKQLTLSMFIREDGTLLDQFKVSSYSHQL